MPATIDVLGTITEKCAVFGVAGKNIDASRLTFYGLWALQHRGQESSGIVSSDGQYLYQHAARGLVSTVYREHNLAQLPGDIAIGHNRYSTSGGDDDLYNQPFLNTKNAIAFAHNGNIPDTSELEKFLKSNNISTTSLNDSGLMLAAIDHYIDQGYNLADAIQQAWPLFTGVFSAVAMDTSTLVAFRDRYGIRPLSLGKLADGAYVVASETCAFDTVGAKFEREIKPGELISITNGILTSHQIAEPNQKLDIFEMIYFARPDSLLLGKRVDTVRQSFGMEMAKELPVVVDVVVPVPDSAIPAGIGFSKASGVPFEMALIKNRYIHRTFIRPTEALREQDIKMKLNPVVELIKDKRVLLIDDSIVRGTTMRRIVSMVFDAGAKEVHLAITCPPVRYPDFYGINTPKQSDLLAANKTVPEMTEYIGATSLHFLSYKGMLKATGLPADSFTTSCFNGIYPSPIGKRSSEIVNIGPGKTLNNQTKLKLSKK